MKWYYMIAAGINVLWAWLGYYLIGLSAGAVVTFLGWYFIIGGIIGALASIIMFGVFSAATSTEPAAA